MTYSSKMEMRACVVSDSWPRVSGNVVWTCPVFPAISYIRDHGGGMFIFLPTWHKRYSKITIHVYIIYIYILYIIPLKKSQICVLQQNLMVTRHFFSGAFKHAHPTSLRWSAIPDWFRSPQRPLERCWCLFTRSRCYPLRPVGEKGREIPPRFVIVLWVNSIVFFCKR